MPAAGRAAPGTIRRAVRQAGVSHAEIIAIGSPEEVIERVEGLRTDLAVPAFPLLLHGPGRRGGHAAPEEAPETHLATGRLGARDTLPGRPDRHCL